MWLRSAVRSFVVVAMINVRANENEQPMVADNADRGAFAAASTILTGALLLIHQGRREKRREEGGENKGT